MTENKEEVQYEENDEVLRDEDFHIVEKKRREPYIVIKSQPAPTRLKEELTKILKETIEMAKKESEEGKDMNVERTVIDRTVALLKSLLK